MRRATPLLLLGALLLPAWVPGTVAEPAGLPAVGAAVDAAALAARRGDWANASANIERAAAEVPGVLPEAPPGRDLAAHLGAARSAADAAEGVAARTALASARAAVLHAALAASLEALGEGRWEDAGGLEDALDLFRAGDGLRDLVEALGSDGANATLRDRIAQRLHDRVAEEARIELRLAEVAAGAGLADEARVRAGAAGALAAVLEGSGQAQRLPAATLAEWRRALAELAAADGDPPATRDAAARLQPLLLAVGLGRTLAALDDLGAEVLDGALAWERAVLEQRSAATLDGLRLRAAAGAHLDAAYAEVRRALFLTGEGSLEPLEGNLSLLRARIEGVGGSTGIREAVEGVRDDLRRIAHLTFGAFAKLEFVHVPPGGTVLAGLVAGRFPLEGVASWRATFAFAPGVARVAGVEAGPFRLAEARWDNATGALHLAGEAAPPVARDATLARVRFEGAGLPGQETDVSVATFAMTAGDGGDAELFLVRGGRVILADIQDANDTGEEEDPLALSNPDLGKRSPAAGAALAAAVLALAARGRRRPR